MRKSNSLHSARQLLFIRFYIYLYILQYLQALNLKADAKITDNSGRKARYQADSTGKLLKVEGIQGEISTYEYTTRNNAHLRNTRRGR